MEKKIRVMKKRIIYFDLIKILAIIMVIINHSYWYVYDNSVFIQYFNRFLLMFSKAAVPLFFMVSGALILKKQTNYKEIFTKRIVRVLVPLVFVCILWTLYKQQNLLQLIPYLVNGNSELFIPYWIWYLYAMIALYIMTPFLQKMLKNFNNKDYLIFILLFLIFPSSFKLVSAVLPVIFDKNIIFNPDFLDILFTIQIGYFVTGYYLSNIKVDYKYKNISIILLIICLLFSTGFTIYANDNSVLDSYLYLTTVIEAISIFIIFKYYFEKGIKNQRANELIINLSNSVFGVYLFHCFVILFLINLPFIQSIFSINGFLGLFVMDFITLVSLTLIVYFLRKIPLLKKFL